VLLGDPRGGRPERGDRLRGIPNENDSRLVLPVGRPAAYLAAQLCTEFEEAESPAAVAEALELSLV